ncbi:MAG: hypothetical protein ACJ8BF_08905 [Gemmatimonadales bacterium]
MIQQRWFITALILAACGGGGGAAPAQPAGSAAGAVQSFMKAVADSNLPKMATLWGTASGSAAKTNQPPDWQRRVAIMQAYLRSDSFRLSSDLPQNDPNHREVQVELRRQTCTWSVPFVAVKTGEGWLVTKVDLASAGNPARPCQEGSAMDSTRRQ